MPVTLPNYLFFILLILFIPSYGNGQPLKKKTDIRTAITSPFSMDLNNKLRLYSRSTGLLVGIQKGKYTYLELGAERHWKTIRLIKPRMYSASLHAEYSFENNQAAYKAGFWTRRGRLDLTFGGYINYFTDFTCSAVGMAPTIGFRLLNFHLLNGYNINFFDNGLTNYNKLYFSLRFFVPYKNKLKLKK
ncbi:MAG TPA: hypothetical protein VIK89_15135 [Cytophagaceae bacterium]